MTSVVVFVVGLAVVEFVAFLIMAWKDRRSDPYVTLSDRRLRLKALRKKD